MKHVWERTTEETFKIINAREVEEKAFQLLSQGMEWNASYASNRKIL